MEPLAREKENKHPMEESGKVIPPESERLDDAHRIVKAALGGTPVVGTALSEFFDRFVAPPLRRKQQLWMERIGTAIYELQNKFESFDANRLADSPEFASAVLVATQAAMKTNDESKLTALRNAVLNVALEPKNADFERDLFFYLVDRLTPYHLQILRLHVEYERRKGELGKTPKATDFPLVSSDLDLANMAIQDLADCHLLSVPEGFHWGGFRGFWTNKYGDLGTNNQRFTDLGKRFLSFVSEP